MSEKLLVEMSYASDQSMSSLMRRINEDIKDGWQPFGSIVIDPESDLYKYAQPMVRYKDNGRV